MGPQGLMPVLPTDAIIARNVLISANFTENERKFIRETLSGSVSGGWGPFSTRGSYTSTTTREDVVGSFDGTTLRIANPQVIGFMGTLIPQCPNPDRRLPFEEDADFGDPDPALSNIEKFCGGSSDDYLKLAGEQSSTLRLLYSINNEP